MRIETVKAPITESEKKLLDIISKSADRIATFAHLGQRDFTIEDVLSKLDCDLHDIKRLIRDSTAEILKEKTYISAAASQTETLGVYYTKFTAESAVRFQVRRRRTCPVRTRTARDPWP